MGRSDALAALGTACPGVVDRAGLEARDLLPPPVRPGLPVAWPGGLPGTTRPDDLAEVGRADPRPCPTTRGANHKTTTCSSCDD